MRLKSRYVYLPQSVPSIWRAVVILLVIIIAVLQVVHITLLSRLEAKKSSSLQHLRRSQAGLQDSVLYQDDSNARSIRSPRIEPDVYDQAQIQEDKAKMLKLIECSNILDISGEYHIINDLLPSTFSIRQGIAWHSLTLITQCTINHLSLLPSLTSRWQGPVSITVFSLARDLPTLVEAILQLRSCYPQIRHNVSFHLVYPLHSKPISSSSRRSASLPTGDCSSLNTRLSQIVSKDNYAQGVAYPVNLLRNVARNNAKSKFVFVVDADLQLNEGLHEKFMRFAKDNMLLDETGSSAGSSVVDKNVFVVPAFEAPQSIKDLPRNKTELTKLLDKGHARPFYQELCSKCHIHTDYESWLKAPEGDGSLSILYQVSWKDPWEPFYISTNKVPMYDERFRQYGFNRISQTCELHIAGYSFAVLNNAFVVHRGLKKPGGFHKNKEADLDRNRQNFRNFKNELKDKYKDSPRRCY